jgi:hypothetical protein
MCKKKHKKPPNQEGMQVCVAFTCHNSANAHAGICYTTSHEHNEKIVSILECDTMKCTIDVELRYVVSELHHTTGTFPPRGLVFLRTGTVLMAKRKIPTPVGNHILVIQPPIRTL